MSVIPDTWEVEMGRLRFKANPGKILPRSHLNQNLGVVACACHPKLHMILRSGGLWFQPSPGKKVCETPISKEKKTRV
jgi:hypothetical protein